MYSKREKMCEEAEGTERETMKILIQPISNWNMNLVSYESKLEISSMYSLT
jgi:hypothetical protein